MSFTSATALYKKILYELNEETSTAKDIVPLIVKELKKKGRKMVILILDEIDILDDRHQEMLNTIFSLPKFKSAKVIIVGIANTLGLISSKLTRFSTLNIDPIKEVAFQSYDGAKIAGILMNRIQALNEKHQLIENSAITYCAMSIAKSFGDARKALEIMRRSVELVEQEAEVPKLKLKELNNQDESIPVKKKVTIPHVNKILKIAFATKLMEVEADDYTFPVQQKLVLCLLFLFHKEGIKNPGKLLKLFI